MLLAHKTRIAVPRDLSPLRSEDRAPADLDLASLGLTRAGLDGVWQAVEGLYRTGLHPAIAVCLRRQGQVVLERAIGHARGGGPHDPPGTPRVLATPETPFCVFSASKAITALLIHHLDDEGLLHIDDRVAEYLPEFGCNGKERTTIRHILTHRAGIPSVAGTTNDPALLDDWDGIIRLLCEARPTWEPGRRLAYHAITGGFVLGEIVRRVTGKDVRRYLAETVLEPLGFRRMNYGLDPAELDRVAVNAFTGRELPFPVSRLVHRALGVGFRQAVELSNDPRYVTRIVPAGNIYATAGEAARFYELLLNEGELDGRRVLRARTIRRARTESSYLELDLTLAVPIRYGLGFQLGSDVMSLYGPGTGQAFGHLGFIHIFTWADPQRRLAAALLTSGKPFVGLHLRRVYELLAAIARGCPPL